MKGCSWADSDGNRPGQVRAPLYRPWPATGRCGLVSCYQVRRPAPLGAEVWSARQQNQPLTDVSPGPFARGGTACHEPRHSSCREVLRRHLSGTLAGPAYGGQPRLALLHARGELAPDEPIIIESIIGSSFTGMITEELRFGPHKAIIPEIEGRAFITGQHTFILDPQDPFRDGFLLR